MVGTRNTRSKGSEHVWVSIGKPGKWWIYGERMVKKSLSVQVFTILGAFGDRIKIRNRYRRGWGLGVWGRV